MRRKPCASHCVTKPLCVAYRPSSLVFFCGTMRVTVSSVKASGTSAIVSFPPLLHVLVLFHSEQRNQFQFVAIQHQRHPLLRGIAAHGERGLDQGVVGADVDVELTRSTRNAGGV